MTLAVRDASGNATLIDPLTGGIITADRLRSTAYAAALEAGIDPGDYVQRIEMERGFEPAAWADMGDPFTALQQGARSMRLSVDAGGATPPRQDPGDIQEEPVNVGEPRPSSAVTPGAQNRGVRQPRGPIKAVDFFGNQVQITYADSALEPEWWTREEYEGWTGQKYDASGRPLKETEAAGAANRAALGQRQYEFGQTFQQRQAEFNTDDAFRKAQFELTNAQQRYNESRDKRDFTAEQFWKSRTDFWQSRADELSRLRLTEDTRQFERGLDVRRGETLLNLGQRPGTLGRYLYALQGQQAPQGFNFEPPSLPGFGAESRAATAPGALPGIGAPALPGVTSTPPTPPSPGPAVPQTPLAQAASPLPALQATLAGAPRAGDLAPFTEGATARNTATDPLMAAGVTARNPIEARTVSAQNELLAQGRVPRAWMGNVAIFDQGGIIPEPVIGEGTRSGLPYIFGEEGEEYVVPKGDSLSDVKRRTKGGRSGKFQGGGLVGFDPRRSMFNPASLPGFLSGDMLRPGIPNFPQYRYLTGGGESLLPSAQALSRALPSEVDLYGGFLRDEAGVDPNDALTLAGRMAPRGGPLSLRYAR